MASDEVITVVSGLPRSGTSLMMKMLAAGGMTLLADEQRAADADNPGGYFEYAPVKRTARDASWVPRARGKAVKVIHALLHYLPSDQQYRLIFMERNLDEVLDSQQAMLDRSNTPGAALSRDELRTAYQRQLGEAEDWIAQQPSFRAAKVCYNQLLREPENQICRVIEFIEQPLDRQAMAAVIDPALYRQRRAGTDRGE